MELEDKFFAIIDEELKKLEQAIENLKIENNNLKKNIENKENILQQIEKITEDSV